MKLDDDGRRLDGRPLTYSRYINVPALLESLRIPKEVPKGIRAAEWPEWPDGWRPGDPWPRGERWCHDEALFITTHQAFEVWFRQMLHELDDVLARARRVAARHGRSIPRVHLADRTGDGAATLRSRLGRYPRLREFVSASDWREHVLDAVAPAEYGPGEERPRLAWFSGEWSVCTERVRRARAMLEVCLPFYDVLLHMTPASFLEFRSRLVPASGFGSGQWREIEIVLGVRERHFPKLDWSDPELAPVLEAMSGPERELAGIASAHEERFTLHCPDDLPRIRRRMTQPSLRDLVYWLLGSVELGGEAGERRWATADALAASNYAQIGRAGNPLAAGIGLTATADVWSAMGALLAHAEAVLSADLHRAPGEWRALEALLDACLGLDGAVLAWRDAHLRFVERVIGSRPGTGGGGLPYLRRTVDPGQAPYLLRAFPCLWQARTLLL